MHHPANPVPVVSGKRRSSCQTIPRGALFLGYKSLDKEIREVYVGVINRRALVTATTAIIAAPTVARGKECPAAGMDWMNMSLQARNLAYNNGEHVGLDFARTKTESWIAASKALR